MSMEAEVRSVKQKHSLELLAKPFVLGVGIAEKVTQCQKTGELCIMVYVSEKFPPKFLLKSGKDALVPSEVDGVKTDVVRLSPIGIFDTVDLPQARRMRLRPAPGGCSISHYAINGRGTLGRWIEDAKTGEPLLISCWHVIANYGMAVKGDPILQPGRIDGGKLPDDTIALLERWVDVKMLAQDLDKCKERIHLALENGIALPTNRIDAAVAKPVSDEVVSYEILGMRKARHASEQEHRTKPIRGNRIVFSGATSGVRRVIIYDTDVDILVSYRALGWALFTDQTLMTNRGYGLGNPAKYIEEELDVRG